MTQPPMTPDPIQLNPEQREAVESPGSPLLIIAGAGTGKTRVITERVAYLLDHVKGLSPDNVVALTFTNRATNEMAARIRAKIGPSDSGDVSVATFHSFALRIMQEQSARLNRPRETELLDNYDFWVLLYRHLERLQLEVFWKNAEPGKFLRHLIDFMSRAHDELVSVEDYDAYVSNFERRRREDVRAGRMTAADAEEEIKREREIARVYRVATELLAEAGAQTFGDVIASAVRLLQKYPDVREHYEKKFRAILVDEFQDTNVAQIELLRLLAESHQNITVVGDDDQAIYRFRGASSESFNLFAKFFPGFQQRKLTQNYRSTKRILRVANELITANPERFDPDKRLWTEHEEGRRVVLIETSEPDDEALTVAEEIERMHERGRPFLDIAVLYRAHSHRDMLVRALRRKSIPFQVVRQSVRTCPAVRDLFGLMRFVAKTSDNIACARVLSLPRWGLTEDEFVMLTHRRARHSNQDGTGRPSLFEVVQTCMLSEPASPLSVKLAACIAWTQSLEKTAAHRPALGATQILIAELQNQNSQMQPSLSEISRLERNTLAAPVRRVLEFVETWQKKNADGTLKLFLEYFDLFREAWGDIYENEETLPEVDAVRLLTVHAAKGLEYPVVFVLRLTQNYFPDKHHVQLLEFPNELRKEGLLPLGDFHTHEERRLCYVALTRAQQELWLTSVQKPRWKPSIFLDDIRRNRAVAEQDIELLRVKPSGEDLAAELWMDRTADETTISFSRVPFWALRNRPVKSDAEATDASLLLSASSMESYQTCPMKFKFSHLYKLTAGPSAALTYGAILHECVKQFFAWKQSGEEFSFEKLEEYLWSRWRSVGFDDDYQEKRYRQTAVNQLRNFYQKHRDQEIAVLAQERNFEFHIEDLKIIGRVDQINEGTGEEVELIDYKTGRPKEQKDAEKSFQLSVYALACESLFKHRPAILSFYNLENGEKVTTERSAAQMELNRETIRQIAADIRGRLFSPCRNEFVCERCEFQSLCPAYEEDAPEM